MHHVMPYLQAISKSKGLTEALKWGDNAGCKRACASPRHPGVQIPVPEVVYGAACPTEEQSSYSKERQHLQVWERALRSC